MIRAFCSAFAAQKHSERIPERRHIRELRQIRRKLSRAAAHGRNTVTREFVRVGRQRPFHRVGVAPEQQRAVRERASAAVPHGAAGDLSAFQQDVVPTGKHGGQSQRMQKIQHGLHICLQRLRRRFRTHERHVQIVRVLIDRAAARYAAQHRQVRPTPRRHLVFCTLIAAEDHARHISPQQRARFVRTECARFRSQILPRVGQRQNMYNQNAFSTSP